MVHPQHVVGRRPVLYLHIPKAAGTSFGSFLNRQFAPERVLVGAYWETIRKHPLSDLRKYDLIGGHLGYDLAFHLDAPFIITLLRDPVDRLCSVYEFLREQYARTPGIEAPDPDVNHLVQVWKTAVSRPLESFLDSPEAVVRAALIENPQARQLAQATPYLMTDLSADGLRRIAEPRLRSIDVVGVVEHFAESVTVTCQRTGWAVPDDLDGLNLNVTTERPVRAGLPSAVRRRIEDLAAVDMELHEIARARVLTERREAR